MSIELSKKVIVITKKNVIANESTVTHFDEVLSVLFLQMDKR